MTGPRAVLGWDIGGAMLKAARLEGGAVEVLRRPYAVWRDPRGLEAAIRALGRELGATADVALTLTAELADCFRTKAEGVAHVTRSLGSAFPETRIHVFGSDGVFVAPEQAMTEPLRVASANWAATATLAARHVEDALLIDIGTTTADIVPIADGRVAAAGRTDPERLAAGELVYTGAVRTPVAAVARTVPFRGARCRTAAERFAQTGDVHLWLGQITEADYVGETPDGRGTTRDEVAARLARIVCADLAMLGDDELTEIARHISECQVRLIAAAIRQVRRPQDRGRTGVEASTAGLTTGTGAFLARAACERAGMEAVDLTAALGLETGHAAPAVAVALLLRERLG